VEILIVVVILGIVAAVVIPQCSNASAAARANMLRELLQSMRTQIAVFQAHHVGVPPGYLDCDPTKAPDENELVTHITRATTAGGLTAAEAPLGTRLYGPYMTEFPENPVNGKRSVTMIADGAALPGAPSDVSGWIYQPSTLTFKADSKGQDENGNAYFDY